MNYIYTTIETLLNGYFDKSLVLSIVGSVIFAISTIINKNPIISVLYLILLFLSIAMYLITIGANFIGISYLLVYVGAVSILFLFILMLINIRISELVSDTKNSIPLVLVIASIYGYEFSQILPDGKDSYFNKYNDISYLTTNYWENNLACYSDISSIGNVMYTSFSIWLILVSLILALAMVGAIVITIKQNNTNT